MIKRYTTMAIKLTKNEIEDIQNRYIKKDRKTVEEEITFDEERFFTDLDSAIAYLKELKDANKDKKLILEDRWTGYEDRYTRLYFTRLENDDEYSSRMKKENRECNEALSMAKQAKVDAEYERQMKELKRRFGK